MNKLGKLLVLLCLVFVASACGTKKTPEEYIALAQESMDKGELDAARIQLKNALNINEKNAQARWLLGNLYIKLGDGLTAEKEINLVLLLGVTAATALNKPAEADAAFSEARAADAKSVEAMTGKAKLAASKRDVAGARKLLEQVFAVDAKYAPAWSLLGIIETFENHNDAAEQAFTKAIENRADNAADVLNRLYMRISAK